MPEHEIPHDRAGALDSLPEQVHPDALTHPYQRGDISLRLILWFAGGLIAFAVVIHVVLAGLHALLAQREARRKEARFPLAAGQAPLPPEPILEGFDPGHAINLHTPARPMTTQSEPQRLHAYGIDPKTGAVHIPIERAISLLAGRLPARDTRPPWPYADPSKVTRPDAGEQEGER